MDVKRYGSPARHDHRHSMLQPRHVKEFSIKQTQLRTEPDSIQLDIQKLKSMRREHERERERRRSQLSPSPLL